MSEILRFAQNDMFITRYTCIILTINILSRKVFAGMVGNISQDPYLPPFQKQNKAVSGEDKIRKFVLYSAVCTLSAHQILAPTSTVAARGGTRSRASSR